MDEETKRGWDVGLGIFAPILTIGGIIIGVCQFESGERNKVTLQADLLSTQNTTEFYRKLWLERLETYKTIAGLAGNISASLGPSKEEKKKLDELNGQLMALYWGQSIMVEEPPVATALRGFYQSVQDFREGWGPTGHADPDHVKIKADLLVEACRASIERGPPSDPKKTRP